MRVFAVLCTCVVLASVVSARAETRRTLEEVALRKQAGEQAPVVATLPVGTEVTVLATDGRWLRVRAGRVDGYLTRTTVSSPERGGAARTGQWSAGHRTGGQLTGELTVDVAVARATLRGVPDKAGAPLGELPRATRLVVIDAASNPAWIRARDPSGRAGWIARAEVRVAAAAAIGVEGAAATPADTKLVARAIPGGAPPGRIVVRAGLALGVRTLGMDLTSNAAGGLASYLLDASAPAGAFDVDAAIRPSARLVLGGDARLSASTASPGITYPGPSAPAGTIAFRTVAGDLGVRVGARAGRAFDIALRAGAHYDAFLTAAVRNPGMLPRERLLGATLGARVDIVPEASQFAITARLDALVIGGRQQTRGLEDGAASTARALWGGLAMRHAIGHQLAVFGGYEFGRASTEWSGMSARHAGATRTRRIDTSQLIQIGISYAL